MRYFLISFHIKNVVSLGNILIQSDNFPSQLVIQEKVQTTYNSNYEILVLSIFEFKNEKDYLDFQRI